MTDKREHWRNLLEEHRKALQVLELQATRFGKLMVPPHIVTEIQDRKEQIAELETKLAAAPPPPVLEVPPAEPEEERVALSCLSFEPEMILIPAGEFLMGSDPKVDKDAGDGEQPQHTLYLPNYTMAKTPVTNAQYAEFIRDAGLVAPPGHWQTGHWQKGDPPPGKLDHPVVRVSWHDAVAYCNWLADLTGKPYHLSSEAEWEKAARGTDGRIYPWGNHWYPGWCNTRESPLRAEIDLLGSLWGHNGGTTPVGRYPRGASPYGVLDMAGNVWEWTCSLWGNDWESPDFKYPYDPQDGRESLEAGDNVLRVVRGGSWRGHRGHARCVYRLGSRPDGRHYDLGFRVVVSPILF